MVALTNITALLAQSAGEWKDSTKNVIFICVLLLALVAAAIWWLRRG